MADTSPHAEPIGEYRAERLRCDDAHLPGCWNPNLGVTACICGEVWWPGQVGTWHSNPRRAPAPAMPLLGIGVGAPGLREPEIEFFGWDTYYLHADECPARGSDSPCSPCGGVAGTDYSTAVKTAVEVTR